MNEPAAQFSLCSECAFDKHFKARIRQDGYSDVCSLCGSDTHPVFYPSDIGAVFAKLMRHRLDRVDHSIGSGDPLEFYVAEFLGQDLSDKFLNAIVQAVIDTEPYKSVSESGAFWAQWQDYCRRPADDLSYSLRWQSTIASLNHQSRFFNRSATALFADLFSGLKDVWNRPQWKLFSTSAFPEYSDSVLVVKPIGSVFYRSRACNSPDDAKLWNDDPFRHVGPPPSQSARAGRMNAEGVPVLYCSEELDTSLAETRPAISTTSAVITLKTTRELVLLDFRKISNVRGASMPSEFDPSYDNELARRSFLQRLHELISRPIVPGRESEYLITQVMTEYLTHEHQPRVDGVIFESAQRKNGTNCVMFNNLEDLEILMSGYDFPVAYEANSIKFYETTAVSYKNVEKQLINLAYSSFFAPKI